MKMAKIQQILSFVLCIVLIAAVALFTFGCNEQNPEKEAPKTDAPKTFTFIVVDADGEEASFTITSTKKTVGEALFDEGLIEGEDGPYGLYVKKVNGIVADYDVDQSYWSFNINGEYAMTGVDVTDIVDGDTYSFVYTK